MEILSFISLLILKSDSIIKRPKPKQFIIQPSIKGIKAALIMDSGAIKLELDNKKPFKANISHQFPEIIEDCRYLANKLRERTVIKGIISARETKRKGFFITTSYDVHERLYFRNTKNIRIIAKGMPATFYALDIQAPRVAYQKRLDMLSELLAGKGLERIQKVPTLLESTQRMIKLRNEARDINGIRGKKEVKIYKFGI